MSEQPEGAGNPFGEGGFDLSAMLEQAQQMQAQLVQAQAELAATSVNGTAGGLVSVTLSGTGELMALNVSLNAFDGSDEDSLADLGDLVVAAYRNAKTQTDALAAASIGPLAGSLGLHGEPDPGSTGGLPDGGLPGGGLPGV